MATSCFEEQHSAVFASTGNRNTSMATEADFYQAMSPIKAGQDACHISNFWNSPHTAMPHLI